MKSQLNRDFTLPLPSSSGGSNQIYLSSILQKSLNLTLERFTRSPPKPFHRISRINATQKIVQPQLKRYLHCFYVINPINMNDVSTLMQMSSCYYVLSRDYVIPCDHLIPKKCTYLSFHCFIIHVTLFCFSNCIFFIFH